MDVGDKNILRLEMLRNAQGGIEMKLSECDIKEF